MLSTAAEKLEGVELQNGWKVKERIVRSGTQTGGYFSCSYRVVNAKGREAFLKAMDYDRALSSADPASAINALTNAYLFEREILPECGDRKMSRVVRAIESGKVQLPGSGPVEFLIFELARGDIRSYLDNVGTLNLIQILQSLHNMFLGIQ